MSASALSTVEAAIIEYYVKGVEDVTGNSAATYQKIKPGRAQELNSRSAAIVIQPQNNVSERWSTSEFDDFPAPGRSPLVKLTVPFVNFYATAGFSRHVLSEKMSSEAVADIVATQMDNVVDHIDVLMNIVLWGDGTNERARVSATNTTTGVVTCDNSGNLYGSQLIEVNQEVEFRAADGTLRGTATGITWTRVTARSKANKTFTVEQCSSDVANGDRVYPRGGYNSAPRGFAYHVAPTGAWQGLSDRTVYDGTYVPVVNNGGGVLGAAVMDKCTSEQFFQRGRSSKDAKGKRLIYWNTQRDAYLAAGYDMKPQNTDKLDLTFTGITHGGMQEVPEDERDKHVPRDKVCFYNIDELMKFEMDKLGIIKNDAGGVFHQRNAMQGPGHSDGKHVYWGWIGNYGCKYPSKLGTHIYGNSVAGLAPGNFYGRVWGMGCRNFCTPSPDRGGEPFRAARDAAVLPPTDAPGGTEKPPRPRKTRRTREMAVTKFGPLLRPTKTPRKGFYVDNRSPVEIYLLTKLSGDTTYSLATNFTMVKTATIYDPTDSGLAQITTAVAAPSASAANTIDLSVLGAGTQVIVVVEGYEKTAN